MCKQPVAVGEQGQHRPHSPPAFSPLAGMLLPLVQQLSLQCLDLLCMLCSHPLLL
jgi:hypothetical protein